MVLAALAAAAPASAARPLLRTNVRAAESAPASCIDHRHSGPSIARRRLTAPRTGYLTARLKAGRGDWDLAVFARGRRAPVAESAYRGSVEVAAGFVKRGQRLTVQACRRSGGAATARLSVVLERASPSRGHLSMVRVFTPTASRARALSRLGLDVTDRVDPRSSDVVLHGARDRLKLIRAGLTYRRLAPPPRTRKSDDFAIAALPGGVRTTYRRLADYSAEMKALAQANPDLVKPFTLAHSTWLGRPVEGLEITANPTARDGKPVFLMLGLHHAREWPSGEHTLEWAYELVNDYRADSADVRSLLARARVIIVPVSNPDGFNFSREAGEANGHAGGTAGFDASNAEDHRKNCRTSCVVSGGVDINRNYGDRWGGEGGTDALTSETYRGPSPFSEPESQDIRELISGQQVVTMITNHTFGNEILRQPGAEDDFPTPDEPLYKSLGDEMAGDAGYTSIVSYTLYAPNDHVGTTDGWSYFTTGGLGYVIESMPSAFHPAYAQVVQHYETGSGSGGTATGLRGAFFAALASTADAERHSVIRGSAPASAVLRLTKSFSNRTSLGPPTEEHFESTLYVPASGQFEWHVNASGRPLFPAEKWTLTCERPEHTVLSMRQVSVARGQAVQVDFADCTPQPLPPPATPKLVVKLKATRVKNRYRGRVHGGWAGVDPGPGGANCVGGLTIQLRAAGKRVARRRAHLDATCGYDKTLSFRRSALPRNARRKGVKRLRAVVQWGGNATLGATKASANARVKRRR
ncbi:MAG TPA: M14 family zinc carboxypeptidase [Thermoleophilaceae bacterium]|nr:M14 family zinc carboxypeptidase [Thermoleophilaceae bacterium]